MQKTTFLSLPTEIYLHIIEYLDVPSEICLRLACRHLYLALPPVPDVSDTGVKLGIRNQILERKTCVKCNIAHCAAAFPQLIDTGPNLKRKQQAVAWAASTIDATRNISRISYRKAMMRLHGLVYACPAPKQLPLPGAWPDNSNRRLEWSTTRGEYVKYRLPRGGWVHTHRNNHTVHLFEYRGFCGWVYQGQKWSFHCECLRCSPVASDAHGICMFCDPNDSRYIMHRQLAHELYLQNQPSMGKIKLKVTEYSYGKETSWVGRRKNTCMRDLSYPVQSYQDKVSTNITWEPADMPSWSWSWCGVCSPYYTPGPNSRKKKSHEGWNDPALWGIDQCRRRCVPHRLNPQRRLIMEKARDMP